TARNRNAPANNNEDAEASRLAFEVTLIKKSPPPLIVLESVVPQGSDKEELAVEPGKPVLVHVSKIAIRGKIDAQEGEKLIKAERAIAPAAKATELAGFASGRTGKFAFNEELALQPGTQTLRFRAKTANSDEAERLATFFYQPLIPTLEVIEPQRGSVQYGDKEPEEIALRAKFDPTAHPHPFQAKVLRDGQQLPNLSPVIDQQAGTLTAKVPLHPGNNRLQVQLGNEWQAISTTEDINVSYLR